MTRFALLFSLLVATCSWSVDVYAYPGSAVSTGTNPVRSASGTYTLDAPGPTIISAPPDQDLVLTDIFMGCAVMQDGQLYSGTVRIVGSDGVTYGAYVLQSSRLYDGGALSSQNFAGTTGIRIPAGVSISIDWSFTYQNYPSGYHTLAYTVGGYLAVP